MYYIYVLYYIILYYIILYYYIYMSRIYLNRSKDLNHCWIAVQPCPIARIDFFLPKLDQSLDRTPRFLQKKSTKYPYASDGNRCLRLQDGAPVRERAPVREHNHVITSWCMIRIVGEHNCITKLVNITTISL